MPRWSHPHVASYLASPLQLIPNRDTSSTSECPRPRPPPPGPPLNPDYTAGALQVEHEAPRGVTPDPCPRPVPKHVLGPTIDLDPGGPVGQPEDRARSVALALPNDMGIDGVHGQQVNARSDARQEPCSVRKVRG